MLAESTVQFTIIKKEENMTYKKVEMEVYEETPVFAGGCGSFDSNCGNSVHRKGATGACGDYDSNCAKQVHRKTGNSGCGDFDSNCGAKVHRK